jgi:AAA domain/ATP-dependent RecD-like DNA helicase SH3 domain
MAETDKVPDKVPTSRKVLTIRKLNTVKHAVKKGEPQPGQIVKITGIVSNIEYPKSPEDSYKLTVHCVKAEIHFVILTNIRHFKLDDIVSATVEIIGSKLGTIKGIPFVQIPTRRDYIEKCMMWCIKKVGYNVIKDLYKALCREAGSEDRVCSLLEEISCTYNENKKLLSFLTVHIPLEQAINLVNWWYKERSLRRLNLLGISNDEIRRSEMNCNELYDKCKENPYQLPFVSMTTAWDIMKMLGREKEVTSSLITCGEIIRVLYKNLTDKGWTYTPTKFLILQFPTLNNFSDVLSDWDVVVEPNGQTYFRNVYKKELDMSIYITDMRKKDPIAYGTELDVTYTSTRLDIANKVLVKPLDETADNNHGVTFIRNSARFEESDTIILSQDQINAVQGALDHKICCITGGAGTGKTTVITEIIRNLDILGRKYVLCSAIGKAVSRINKVIDKKEAQTIHRLLMGEAEPEHIIIDEASTMSGELFHRMIEDFPEVRYITMLGDINQLPPIGWGSPFEQIIRSGTVPTYILSVNHRTCVDDNIQDGILMNANGIINSETHVIKETDNFSMSEGGIEKVKEFVDLFKENDVPIEDFIIINPYNMYNDEINTYVQSIYNPNARFVIDEKKKKWAIGDKVMLLENDIENMVFNGDEGIIKDLDNDHITVLFDTILVEYKLQYAKRSFFQPQTVTNGAGVKVLDGGEIIKINHTVEELTLSYSITIDKAQGSEWDHGIFYIPSKAQGFSRNDGTVSGSSFFYRGRVYTAWTRFKKSCFNVGCISALELGAKKNRRVRFENFASFLRKKLKEVGHYSLPQPEVSCGDIDDFYDPYDNEDEY